MTATLTNRSERVDDTAIPANSFAASARDVDRAISSGLIFHSGLTPVNT